jgi:hypothetical protein
VAQRSVNSTVRTPGVPLYRFAAVAGTIPKPAPCSTMQHMFSKVRTRAEVEIPPLKQSLFAQIFLKGAAGAQPDEVVIDYVPERDTTASAERVIARDGQDQLVRRKRKRLQRPMFDGIGNNAYFR